MVSTLEVSEGNLSLKKGLAVTVKDVDEDVMAVMKGVLRDIGGVASAKAEKRELLEMMENEIATEPTIFSV